MKGDTKMSAPARTSRTQTISYVDLMKPDEDWRNLPDASERRKIQNRLAQRAYRRNMRDRTREVERLKNQLKKLREEKEEGGEEAPSLAQQDEDDSGSDSGSSSPSVKGDAATQMDDLSPSTIATSEWLGRYFQAWPDSTEPERAVCMDMSSDGDGLAQLGSNAACYSDYQLSPDYQQQIIAPRPMLSKAQSVLPDHFNLEHHQQHAMQSSRAMNESMFHPKAAYQIPSWPSHGQRNVTFETMGDPTASDQTRRVTVPSPPTSLGQLEMPPVPQTSQHPHNPSRPSVGRLLNTEHSANRNGGKANEMAQGGFPSPISELSEQVWQRAKLSSPSPSLVPSRPPSQLQQRQQHNQQQHQQQQQHNQHQQNVSASACTQQTTSPKMTSIAEAPNPQPPRRTSLSTTTRRPSSPEKSPVLGKKQKQKKNEAVHRKSRSATPNSTNKTNVPDQQIATAATTAAASPPPTSLLHLAVGGGHIDTLRLLLQRLDAAALNVRDERGYTALECAVMEGRTDLVALLLEHGAGLLR